MAGYGWSTGNTGYDNEYLLTAWSRTDTNLAQSWTLTAEGDWQHFTENTTTQNRTHGPAHELTAIDSTTLTYDPKGNLTADDTKGHTYTWDFDNRLKSVDTNGDQVPDVSFQYDALGRRVSKTAAAGTTVYACKTEPIAYSPFAGQVVCEYASGGTPASPSEKYIYGTYIDEPIWKTGTGGTVYYHANNLYCVSALTDGSGAVSERYRYTPYGALMILAPNGTTVRTASSYANPYTFTGRRWDGEALLYYYRARYYDSLLGRFVRRDPIGYGGSGDPYLFCGVNPLDYVDPSGFWVWPWDPNASWNPIDTAELWIGGGEQIQPPIIGILPGLDVLPGGIPLPELFLPCNIWNLGGAGRPGRDLVDCFCFGATITDMIPGVGECPYVEAADCVRNVLTAIQVACNRNEAWGELYLALTAIDCASIPVGGAAGVVLGCLTGGTIGTPPAPGGGTVIGCILGGLTGGAAGSIVGDVLVDVGAWSVQSRISCGGPMNAIGNGMSACRRTRRRFFGR